MKNSLILIFLLCLISTPYLSAQLGDVPKKRSSLSLLSSTYIPTGNQAIGEVIINTSKSEAVYLTQGFIQLYTIEKSEIPEPTLPTASIYPNPSADEVIVFWNTINQYNQITVFDNLGNPLLIKQIYQQKEVQLNIDALNAGLYFIRLHNPKSNQIETLKLIKL